MSAQRRVYQVVDRYMTFAREYFATQPAAASTSRQPARVPRDHAPRARRASGCRCRTTATARRTSTWPRPKTVAARRIGAPAALASAPDAAGRGRRRDLHGRGARRRRPAGHREGADHARGPVRGRARRRRGRRWSAPARDAEDVEAFAHGTTVATNALLEGEGARTVLVATEGFEDVVELGRQARADLYRLCAAHPAPLVPPERRVGARERMAPGRARSTALSTTRSTPPSTRVEERSSPRRSPSACCTPTATPSTSSALGEALAERLPDVHVSLSPRGRRHVPRVRARRDDRGRRRPLPPARAPTCASLVERARRRRAARARGDAVQRRAGDARPGRRPRRADRALRPRRRRRRRRLGRRTRRASPTRCASTWAARRCDVCVDPRRRGARGGRARGRRPPGRAADARHPHRRRRRRLDRLARRRAARCASGPRSRGRPARARLLRPRRRRADGHRRQPAARPAAAGHRRAGSSSTARRPRRAVDALGGRARPRAARVPPRASSASPTPRWCARCA